MILRAQGTVKMWSSSFKKSLGILRQQEQNMKPGIGPFFVQGPVQLHTVYTLEGAPDSSYCFYQRILAP